NIPAGVTITFKRNSRNTPVTILASGNVTILGAIDASGGNGDNNGSGGVGGPGGVNGGRAGSRFFPFDGTSGEGPGGGGGGRGSDQLSGAAGGGGFSSSGGDGNNGHLPFKGSGGVKYGTRTLLPLIGGSGGGGAGGKSERAGSS